MANIYNMTDTWTDGSTLTSIKMNVTDTSSAADSKLLDLQVGGSSKLTVGKDGAITAVQASSVIPFYYDSQGLFPSASTYHGAVAHSHNDGAMYFAHGGNWLKLVNADNSGNVGIGTASPTGGKLQIETTNEPGLFVKDTGNTAAPYVRVQGRRGDANRFSSFSGGLVLEAYRSDDKIRHAGKHLGTIYFGGNHTNGTEANISYAASISGVADGAFNSVTDMPTAIAFHTGSSGTALKTANTTFGTERMRISSDGNVGIGIASPSEKLHVADSLRVARSTAAPAIILENSLYSGGDASIRMFNSGQLAFYTDSDQRMQISAGGLVKVFNLVSTGTQDVQANSNGQLVLPASDERLKKEIANSPYGLAAVQALRPVTYRWRNEADRGSATEVGFVAQEVQAVIPEMVNETYTTGMLSVSYSKLTAVLTAAIQEQQTQIEALEARIAALESA